MIGLLVRVQTNLNNDVDVMIWNHPIDSQPFENWLFRVPGSYVS